MSKIIYILSERVCKKKHHVSYDTTLGMENAFVSDDLFQIIPFSRLWFYANKIIYLLIKKRLPDYFLHFRQQNNYLFIAMGIGDLEIHRETLRRAKQKGNCVSIYCFDSWESRYERMEAVFNYVRPDYIFLAYRKSVEYFNKVYSNVYWIPQSMDTNYFFDRDIEKTRLFMQMGRRTESLHMMVLDYMAKKGIEDIPDNYVYERKKGKIIFEETNELADNICKTKYFICAPACIDNSSITGNISEVTARFYEAMACKTLIVGFKPDTFDDIFQGGYMVEVNQDGSDFLSVIDYFEKNPEQYQEIVEKNYKIVMEKNQWTNRAQTVREIMNI